MYTRALIASLIGLLVYSSTQADELIIHQRRVVDGTEITKTDKWQSNQTAVIVCDMWDAHHCLNAVRRATEMAPRMNELLTKMRGKGAIIIHAPSSCTEFYKDHPARIRSTKTALSTSLPDGIKNWCDHIPAEKDYPLDQSDGGEDDQPQEHAEWAEKLRSQGKNPRAPWTRQLDSLTIDNEDYISDKGDEIWSILESRGIKNILMVGVHTNMCVLGRPFGLRQLSKNGKNVVLVRDLTDTMYNPQRWPFVDHYQGNRLIHRHIEKYVCGTITSDQLLGGKPFRFKNDRPQRCLILCAESLYETEKTLKRFSENVLEQQLGFDCTLMFAGKGQNSFPKEMVNRIESTDLLVLSMRRRALPEAQLKSIRSYLSKGKPMVAIRTSSHAFDTKGNHPDGHAEWKEFDSEILGCHYNGHHANGLECTIQKANDHILLSGVELTDSKGSLYRSAPLTASCTALLFGKVDGQTKEPVAWINGNGKSRVFYTSLGHPSDFEQAGFVRLLENGVRWTTGMKIGPEPVKKK